VLHPERAPVPLTTPKQKEALLGEVGIAVMLVVRFTPEFSRVPARQFVREFLHEKLRLQEIYVGEDFVFGHQREGNLDLLRRMGEESGFAAHGMREVSWSGERISSTRIRQALSEGKTTEAAEMLGRPYSIAGTIARGDRMGQKLGWPTINVASENKLLPADGVYAARVFFPSYPATFDGVTNIGTRPTVYENYQRVVESHILDFKANVYGQRVELQFHKRLREERIFPSVMDLSAQIGRDVEATREYFAARRRVEQEAAPGGLEEE
jgi:riboflavin kinase/FMN adenylyltransferase